MQVRYPMDTSCTSQIKTQFNPEFEVAIYYGLKILAAAIVVYFETPVFLTGSQR